MLHCMTHPEKFSPNCPKGTNWTKWAKNYGQWGHKNTNPWTHSLTSLHKTQMEPRLDIQGIQMIVPAT